MKDRIPITALFLGANARDTERLELGAEVRDIREAIEAMGAGGDFRFEAELAVRPTDLQKLLLKYTPEILHFSGHGIGSGGARAARASKQSRGNSRDFLPPEDNEQPAIEDSSGGILLVDRDGASVTVNPEALTELLEIARREPRLRCVVLNACFTASQAEGIQKHVECVIGMSRAVDDAAATAFAIGFYRALAAGESVAAAFKFGRSEIGMRGLPDKDVPKLFHRPEVKPEQVFVGAPVVSTSEPPGSGEGAEASPKLPWRRRVRRAAPALLGFVIVLILAALLLPPSRVPATIPGSDAIVVAGPWLSGSRGREARRALCGALEKDRRDEGLRCIDLPLIGADPEGLRAKALEAGAALLVLVDEEGTARVRPLGPLSGDEIFDRGLPPVDLTTGSPAALAPILRTLAHITQLPGGLDRLDPNRLRCPVLDSEAPRSVVLLGLLAGMFVPGCAPSSVDGQKLLGRCSGGPGDGEECKLAIFLYAYRFPSARDTPKLIGTLQQGAAYRFWSAAMRRGGRVACTQGRLDDAKQATVRLWESADVCVKLMASTVAACVLSEGKGMGAAEEVAMRAIEGFADVPAAGEQLPAEDARAACGEPMRGGILAGRAWGRARGGRWNEAAADFRDAERLDPKNWRLYRASLVEVLLRGGRRKEAREELRLLDEDTLADERSRVHVALLTWIYARREGFPDKIEHTAARLVEAYGSFPFGERVFNEPSDPVLRPLACPDSAERCVYDILAEKKTGGGSSEVMLKAALDAARTPIKAEPSN
jgi:hypothetical protein